MLLHFVELGTASDRRARELLVAQARRLWYELLQRPVGQGPLLTWGGCLEVLCEEDRYIVQPTELSARPLAALFREAAPDGLWVCAGVEPCTHPQALAAALSQTGVDLSTSRVRMGFTRGHLLDVVVTVPLDVDGDHELLQVASEVYLERRLGHDVLDTWVHDVGVARGARTSGLRLMGTEPAQSYPLTDVAALLESGVRNVQEQLPHCLLETPPSAWTALHIPPADQGFQGDRRYASTCFPEALKSALEGMPFSSNRFTRGPELMVWLRWSHRTTNLSRVELREEAEAAVSAPSRRDQVLLAGTGFGAEYDYVDLWVDPQPEALRAVGEELGELCGCVELGFYDSAYRKERIHFGVPLEWPPATPGRCDAGLAP